MKTLALAGTFAVLMMTLSSNAGADIIGGIDFPDGAISFADEVVSFDIGTNVSGVWADPEDSLGVPDYNGATGAVNIDGVAGVVAGTQYSFVRLMDVAPNQSGSPFGEADIDAIGAISSAPPVTPVPEPVTLSLLGVGLVGSSLARRRARR